MTKLALGMAAIGRPQYINIKTSDSLIKPDKALLHAHALTILDAAYHMGIRHFDTAPGYGIAEEILLDWIQQNQYSDICISTKWGYTYTADFKENPDQHEIKEHTLHVLQNQWEYSKKMLPYLKAYQIHSATLESGVLDNKKILDHLAFIKEEYRMDIGLTTSGIHQNEILQKAVDIERGGKQLFTVYQVTYNLLEQSILSSIEMLNNHHATIIIKEAMANGRIFNLTKNSTILSELSCKYSVGIDAIALRFCIDTIKPTFVLSGAATIHQLRENLLADSFTLALDEIESLKSYRNNSQHYWDERKKLQWN